MAELRPQLDRLGLRLARIPRGMRIETTTLGGVPADWLIPKRIERDTVILYLHGGLYIGGSPRSHRGLLANLAQTCGSWVVAPDYRLAPENPFPAALDDALAAYKALLTQEPPPAGIVIAGDSAGGGLALATALALREAGLKLPDALMLLSPWTDLSLGSSSHFTRAERERLLNHDSLADAAQAYAGGRQLKFPLLSPLFADMRGLPPMLIQIGEDEILFEDSTRLASAASGACVQVTLQTWPGMWHVWQLLAGWLPEADAALKQMALFVATNTPRGAQASGQR